MQALWAQPHVTFAGKYHTIEDAGINPVPPRQRILRIAWRRRSPQMVELYAIKCAMHYHAHRMVQGAGDATGRDATGGDDPSHGCQRQAIACAGSTLQKAEGRNLRIFGVAGRSHEGFLTEPRAGAQPRRREPLSDPRHQKSRLLERGPALS